MAIKTAKRARYTGSFEKQAPGYRVQYGSCYGNTDRGSAKFEQLHCEVKKKADSRLLCQVT